MAGKGNSEGKIAESKRAAYVFCPHCGQPILGGEQACRDCSKEAQIIAERIHYPGGQAGGTDYDKNFIVVDKDEKSGIKMCFDTTTRSFIPIIGMETEKAKQDEDD